MAEGESIPVGYVRRAHGIRGDVVVRGLVGDAAERLVTGRNLCDEDGRTYDVTAHREHRGDVLLHLEGIDDRTSAESMVGTRFVIPTSERRTLDPDEWWAEDIIGCAVVGRDGSPVGEVVDTVSGSAQDRLVVLAPDGRRAEIPLVDALVPTVDPMARTIVVELPEGLFEDVDRDGG